VYVVIWGRRFWGQVRPDADHVVRIQRKPAAGGGYRTVRRVETDARGYFSVRLRKRPGTYRYVYDGGRSGTLRVR
jgi:hypothetical protein